MSYNNHRGQGQGGQPPHHNNRGGGGGHPNNHPHTQHANNNNLQGGVNSGPPQAYALASQLLGNNAPNITQQRSGYGGGQPLSTGSMNPPNKQEWEQFFSKAIPTSATSAPSQQQQAPPQQSTLPTSTPGGIKPPTQQMTPQQQQQLLAMLQNINANQVARTANPVLSANTAVPIAAPVVVPQPQTVQPPSAPLAQSNLDVKQMLMNTLSQAVASQQQQQQASNLTAALAQQLLNQGLNNNQNNNLFGNALNVAQLLQQQQQQQAQQPQQRLNQNDLLTALLTKSLLEANQAQQQQQQQQSVAYEPTSSQQSGQASRGNFDRNDVRYQTSSTSTSSVANTQHTNQPQHSNHHNNANNTAQRNNHSFSSPSSNNRAAAHNNFRKSRWSMSAQDPLALGAFVGIPSSNPDPPTFVPKGYIPNHLQASSFSTSASNMNSMPTSGGGPLRFSQANAGTNQVGASAAAGGRGGGFISHNTKALATNNTIVVRKRGRSSSPSPRRSRSRSPSNRNNFPNTGVNMNRSNTGAAMGSAGASSSLSSHTMPNKASSSSMNTSASTVISTAAGNRAAVSVRGNVPIAATTSANSTTAAAAAAAASSKPSPSTATTLSSLTLKDLSTKYNLPIITPSTQSLNTMDLNMRYPNLYIPTDFIEVVIDWQEVLSKLLHEDYFVDLLTPCHPVIESNPSIMITETLPIALPQSIGEDNKGVGETREEQNVENVDNNFEVFLQQKAFQTSLQPDSLLPPKYTYLYDNVINHTLTSDPLCSLANHNRSSQAIYTMKEQQPIRFNVRILLSYGLSSEEESITERQAFRKLRVLLGRRKSMQTLLGAVYHSQLDGGNPLLDRNCLEETAKRALFAQCGIPHLPHTDASSASSNKAIPSAFCRLGELHYHRPREEIASKIYPEQEEISVLYLYRLDTKLLQQEVEEYVEHYLEQQEENQGEDHAHDHTEEEESFELKKKECLQGIEEKLWQVFQRRVLGSHPGPLLSHTYQEEIFPSLEANFDNAHEMEEKMEETKQKTMFNRELQRFNDKIGDLLQSQEREKQMKLQKLVAAGVMKAEELQLPTTVIATNAVTPSASSEDSPIVEEAIAEASPTVDSNNNTTDDAVVNMEESKATDEKIPSSEEEAVVVSHVPTEAYNIHGELLKASILQRHHKPTSLNYLIAPMPLPFEYHTNKKSDSFALRSTVLSSLLSYSLDDTNEKLFEVSICAEILSSYVSLSYCTLVTDVLLSQYPDLHYLADDRLLEAVAVLKEAKKPKQKVEVTKPIIVAPTVVVEEEKTEAKEENKPEDAMEQDIPVATTTVEESAAIPEETALESVEAKVDEVDDSKTGNVVEDETPENAEDEADGDEEMMQDVEDPANDVSSDYQKMSLEEANIWRTRFIVACKYFDTNHEKFLRADILKMIVSSSLRKFTRIDLNNIVEGICPKEQSKFLYELYM